MNEEVVENTVTELEVMNAWCKKHKKTLDDFLALDKKVDLLGYIEIACFQYDDRPMNENIEDLDEYINIKLRKLNESTQRS